MKSQNKNDETKQIIELFFLWLRHWYYFVITFAVLGTIGIVYYKTATPVMNTLARVSLRHDDALAGGGISRANSIMSAFGLGSSSANIEDESLKMGSQGLIRNVVENLSLNKEYILSEYMGLYKTNLYDSSPITLSVDPTISDTITRTMKFTLDIESDKTKIKMKAGKEAVGKYEITTYPATIETPWGKYTFEKSPLYDLYEYPLKLKVNLSSYDGMAQIYRKKLLVDYEKRTSDFINLGFKCEDVPFAKKVLNEVINIYNTEWEKDKELVSNKTLDFIDNRLVLTHQALSDADVQIQQFKDKYNLTEIEADVTYYLRLSGELQAQLLEAETQLNIVDIIVNFVQDEKNKYALIPFSLAASEPGIVDAISKYNEQLTRRNELYKTNNQNTFAQSLNEQIEVQRVNLLLSLENVKKGLQIAKDNLKKKEREFNQKIGNVPTIERDYVSLRREQEIQQTIYIFLLEMREQSAVKGISLLPKLKIVDHPYVLNDRVSPRLMNVGLVVFILGMIISLSLVYGIPLLKTLKRKE